MYQNQGLQFFIILFVLGLMVALPLSLQLDVPLGLDLKGGAELVFNIPGVSGADLASALDVIRKRLDAKGMKEIEIRESGVSDFLVKLPGVAGEEADRIVALLTQSGKMDFKIEANKTPEEEQKLLHEVKQAKAENRWVERTAEWDVAMDRRTGRETLLVNKGFVSGRYLTDAFPGLDQFSRPAVKFQFGGAGSKDFGALTTKHKGEQLAIVLDGVIQSAPTIQEAIYDSGEITGDFTKEEVDDIVAVLKGGSLPSAPQIKYRSMVGPGLGHDSIIRGQWGILYGLLAVIVFVAIYYLGAGLVANVALVVNLVLIVSVLMCFEATLTLPGIAGILLTIGMSVDANILIFERIREEKAKGKALRQAVQNGYGRAFWTIFDSNLTTLVTAAILYYVGTGPIKGFAITLSIGILASMFTALYVSRAIMALAITLGWFKEVKMLRFFATPSVPFTKYFRPALIASAICIALGLGLFGFRGQRGLGIDFTGGALVQLKFDQDVAKADLERRLTAKHDFYRLAEVQVMGQQAGTAGDRGLEFQFRTRIAEAEGGQAPGGVEAFRHDLIAVFGAELAPETFGAASLGQVQDGQAPLTMSVHMRRTDGELTAEYVTALLRARTPQQRAKLGDEALAQAVYDQSQVTVRKREGRFHEAVITTGAIATAQKDAVVKALKGCWSDASIDLSEPVAREESIGQAQAVDFLAKGVLSILAACLAIVIYVGFRFEFVYGVGAVIALVHDAAMTIGAMAVADALGFDMKINLPTVAAVLTVIGYSINDTIVVFDRIRETVQTQRRMDMRAMVELAVNQTLSRTILTAGTTLLTVIALMWTGIDVLVSFGFALFVGLTVGTYSSVYIAAPVMLWLRRRAEEAERREKERERAGGKKQAAEA